MTTAEAAAPIAARIHAITYGAEGVLLFDLRAQNGDHLPAFEPGAHVDIFMPAGLQRSYSLLNDASERHRYVLGIKREEASRGGSLWMHDGVRTGSLIEISAPKNQFALIENAPHSVFVAGGIGITPLWSMIQRLLRLGRPWTLFYRARSRVSAPLLDALEHADIAPHVHLSFSEDATTVRLNLAHAVLAAPSGSHFYCCGPAAMMTAFEMACSHLDPSRVHLEHFAASEAPATEGGFLVRLAKSGKEVLVLPGQTILESLRTCGVNVPSSCQQGVCGACEMNVLAGTPDHRDLVLSPSEKAAGKSMMICCSGSLSNTLTLDA